ncbi:hypothetical protein PQQ99_36340 [Paraburkholderia sediminicola]|uniref:hypothetical protein n=1 Tax=Paraburkholderia TaxID=1822464 RepID=UPI0038B88A9A
MGTIPVEKCIVGAWRDTVRVIDQMPILFLIMFGVSLGIVRIEKVIHLYAALRAMGRLPHSGFYALPYLRVLANHASNIGEPILAIPIIRYVIDGERFKLSSISLHAYGRYFVISIIFATVFTLAIAIVQISQAALQATGVQSANITPETQTLTILLLIGAGYVLARSALLFPHVAVGGRMQWRAAWTDTRGQALKVACIYGIGSALPSYLVARFVLPFLHQSFNSAGVDLFSEALIRLMAWTLGAATLAWIYRKFARDIRLAASTTHNQMLA